MLQGGSTSTDRELVDAVRAGDASAFELLYRAHEQAVRRAVAGTLRDPEKAADAVQDVFLRALERIETLRDPDKLAPWLLAMARNAAVDQHRVRIHDDVDEAPEAKLQDPDLGPDERAELRDLAHLVRGALAELSPRDVQVVSMTAYLGFTPTEVGGAMGMTPGAAKVALHRARRRLRTALELELLVRRQGSSCEKLGGLLGADDLIAAARHVAHCESCRSTAGEELELYEAYRGSGAAPAFAIVAPGSAREKRVPVIGRLVVGRECAGVDEAHRLVIDDPAVSRHHVEIRGEPDLGGAYAVDTSANGTRLNGRRIERGILIPLSPGDVLEIGDTEIRFEAGPAGERSRAAAKTTVRRYSHGPMAMVVGDIVGYSRIAAANDSAALTAALDRLFGELQGLLRLHGGMLANYAGDAFFGAWELDSVPDGTERALTFALQGADCVAQLAPDLPLDDAAEGALKMGWGVTTGEATVSVLTGALTTVVGDAANLAFRLSGLAARAERAQVLVALDRDEHVLEGATRLERVDIKGRAEPVDVYAVSASSG